MSIRNNTSIEPHVVQHMTKHEAGEQANIDMSSPKPCTMNVSTSDLHTIEHSRPARPLTKGHKSTTEIQGKETRQTHVGQHNNKHVAMEQANIDKQWPKQYTYHESAVAMYGPEHSLAASPLRNG